MAQLLTCTGKTMDLADNNGTLEKSEVPRINTILLCKVLRETIRTLESSQLLHVVTLVLMFTTETMEVVDKDGSLPLSMVKEISSLLQCLEEESVVVKKL